MGPSKKHETPKAIRRRKEPMMAVMVNKRGKKEWFDIQDSLGDRANH